MTPHAFAALTILGVSLAVPGDTHAAPVEQTSNQARQSDTMRFRGMDRNRDGVITRTEWRGSDQSFRSHDWNGDGILSGSEVRVGATRDAQEDEDYDQTRRPEFTNWTVRGFQNLDHDGDRRISRAEWHYDYEGFNRADRNRDGVLTREEFLGNDTDLDREDRFENLDANRNGRVERSEWHGSRDAFEWMDRNNDGALSRTEVLGSETAPPDDLFASLDINDDDAITQEEWHWSRRSFTRQDQNGDGRLTRGELTNAELSAANAGTVGTAGRTIVVDGREQWADTGLDVRAGETIAIQASGSVGLSDNTSDVATPAGSRARRAASAPMPGQPAGALIARIGDGSPIAVGTSQTITANRAGRLYLGVNDDYFLDNRGEFRVTVQRR